MSNSIPDYFCDGICENCTKGKWFNKGQYYSCDPEKVKSINVISPIPVWSFSKKK